MSVVEKAVQDGASTLAQIYDRTGAGTGPCRGSCRVILRSILAAHAPPNQQTQKIIHPPPAELVRAVSLFNRRYYWETHEVLEHVWMDEHGKARLFYQGLIQASAALYHVINANPQGVIRLAEEAQKKLAAYLPEYFGIPLENIIKALKDYVVQSREIMGNLRAGFDYDALPQLDIGLEA